MLACEIAVTISVSLVLRMRMHQSIRGIVAQADDDGGDDDSSKNDIGETVKTGEIA